VKGKVWGGGVGLKAGPLDVKLEAGVINGKAEVGSDGELKVTASALKAKAEVGFGGNKASASGEVLKGVATVSKEGVKLDGKLATASAEASRGSFNIDNSAVIGVSGKLGPVEVEGNVNLGHAVLGAVHLVEAAGEYLKGKFEDYFQNAPWSTSK